MATFHFRNASVTINTVDLSDHVRSVTLTHTADTLDETAMGDTFRNRIAGLQDWSLDVEFLSDFANAEIDHTLNALVGAAPFAVILKADAGATSATNPKWTGNVLLESYPIIDGTVGDLAVVRVRFVGAGTLTRGTSD